MKIAIVTSFPKDPSTPVGGVEAVSVNLVSALSHFRDLEIHVVTLDSSIKHNQIMLLAGVGVHRIAIQPARSVLLNALTTGRNLVKSYLDELRPDVVHAHDTYGLMVYGLKVPRIFTIHGFIYGDTLVSGSKLPRLRGAIWKWIETRGWADQPHIVSISPYVRERLSGVVKGKIYDIENPIAESFFKVERQERKGVIFSAAVISPRKNTLALIDAVSLLTGDGFDVRLRLAGKIVEPSYGKALQDRIAADRLSGKVTLLGSIGMEQVQAELSQASVFALVSLEENAPLGIEEAMAVGVPVVASNRCGMPYMVKNGESGYLINPKDPKEIAKALRQILADDRLRKEMGEKSRAIAVERFHPMKVAELTKRIYYEVKAGACAPDANQSMFKV